VIGEAEDLEELRIAWTEAGGDIETVRHEVLI